MVNVRAILFQMGISSDATEADTIKVRKRLEYRKLNVISLIAFFKLL